MAVKGIRGRRVGVSEKIPECDGPMPVRVVHDIVNTRTNCWSVDGPFPVGIV